MLHRREKRQAQGYHKAGGLPMGFRSARLQEPSQAESEAKPKPFRLCSKGMPKGAETMRRFAETCEAIAATPKKLLKIAAVAEYFQTCATEEAAAASVFLSGRAFPAWEETTLQVGGRLLWRVVAELSGKPEAAITEAYRRHGDLGA